MGCAKLRRPPQWTTVTSLAARRFRPQPEAEQIDPGLGWIGRIIAGNYGRFSNQSWHLATWLSELRASVRGDEAVRIFRSVVDGLATAGDDRFVAIQRAEEDGPDTAGL